MFCYLFVTENLRTVFCAIKPAARPDFMRAPEDGIEPFVRGVFTHKTGKERDGKSVSLSRAAGKSQTPGPARITASSSSGVSARWSAPASSREERGR